MGRRIARRRFRYRNRVIYNTKCNVSEGLSVQELGAKTSPAQANRYGFSFISIDVDQNSAEDRAVSSPSKSNLVLHPDHRHPSNQL
jgi:hypothetical protein